MSEVDQCRFSRRGCCATSPCVPRTRNLCHCMVQPGALKFGLSALGPIRPAYRKINHFVTNAEYQLWPWIQITLSMSSIARHSPASACLPSGAYLQTGKVLGACTSVNHASALLRITRQVHVIVPVFEPVTLAITRMGKQEIDLLALRHEYPRPPFSKRSQRCGAVRSGR